MKRKLVKQGLRALTITVPSSWVQKNDLKAGDEIDINEADDNLFISTEKQRPIKEISVDVSGMLPRLADRFMARSYQKGYDKLRIKFDSPELMLAIKNKVPELMGFEILRIEKNEMEIQAITRELELEFDVMVRRAFLILMDMAKTCQDAWKSNDSKALENVVYQDFDANRFLYFCLRDLSKNQKRISFGRLILYYHIETLEDLGDELKELATTLSRIKPDKQILGILNKMNELFRMCYEFFYKPEKNKATSAYLLSKEISKMIYESFDSKSKDLNKALMLIECSIRVMTSLVTMRLDTLSELKGYPLNEIKKDDFAMTS
ncbi:MAG TPA: hypothetical protein VI564_07775 [Candidatus Nanoarchaeia archaeon]|nr:hypothetical protein [Candidatus Nanoarchaeia archaeon]